MGIFDSIKRKLGYDIKNNNGVNEEYWGEILKKKYFKKNGKLHGEYNEYNWDKNDHWVVIQSVYKNGTKHGVTKYFWNKHISAEGVFNNGQETGIIKIYHRKGDEGKKSKKIIEKLADLDKGVYEVYSLNGKILERSEIDGAKFGKGSYSSSDGYYGGLYPIRSGLSEKWFENGKLKEKGYWGKNYTSSIYNLSHRKGKHIQFHENGNILKEGDWVDKVPVGTHKFFYSNGNIEFEVVYLTPKGNISDGDFPEKESIIKEKWYNKNGSLMSSDEIIKKGGIDPRKIPEPHGTFYTWPHEILNQVNSAFINDLNFKRMGKVRFYESYYTTAYGLGHSYELV